MTLAEIDQAEETDQPIGSSALEASALARASVRGIALRMLVANVGGALIVGLYVGWLFPFEVANDNEQVKLNLLLFGSYLVLTLAIALPLNIVLVRRLTRWIRGSAPAGRITRALTVRLPAFEAFAAMVSWAGAALMFLLVNHAPRNAFGVLLAGVLTCSMIFLNLEQHLEPVVGLALDGKVHGRLAHDLLPRLMLFWALGSALPFVAVGLAPLVAERTESASGWRLVLLVSTGLLAGGIVMRRAARSITEPVEALRQAMASVADGDLDQRVPVERRGELGRLAAGFNHMVAGLAERERIRAAFGRQVSPQVVEWELSRPEGSDSSEGEEAPLSVLFVDLTGFTSYSEHHTPAEVVEMLNEFFQVVDDVVTAHGGWINKFEGDAAMCVFGVPVHQHDHAERALRAARQLQQQATPGGAIRGVGIGVASGRALAGLVGSSTRNEYTVIGDVVNVAARVCEQAKLAPGGVLATGDAVGASGQTETWDLYEETLLRGRTQTTRLYAPSELSIQPAILAIPQE